MTFSPKLCDKSLKKKRRTLEQMIQDLYVKPQSERGSASKNRRVTSREGSTSRRSLSGAGQNAIFERLYKEAIDIQQKKFDV